jgi:hypothetical protein
LAPASERVVSVTTDNGPAAGPTKVESEKGAGGKVKERQCLRRHETHKLADKQAGKHLAERLLLYDSTTRGWRPHRLVTGVRASESKKARQQSAPLPQLRLASSLWTPRTCLLQQQAISHPRWVSDRDKRRRAYYVDYTASCMACVCRCKGTWSGG